MFKKNLYLFLFLGILILAFFLRFYKLGQIPDGLYQDETAIGYNAYSILKTGRDEHGVSFPFYFQSFGDYKMPVYIYLTSLAIKLFGLNAFAVRFFSFVSGFLAVAVLFYLLKDHFGWKMALWSAFLLAINPWHLFFSRAGLEVNTAVSFALFGLYFFEEGVKNKRFRLLIVSLLFFGFSFFTYNVSRIIVPVFMAFLVYFHRSYFRQMSRFKQIILVIVFFLLLTPFLSGFLKGGSGLSNQTSELIFGGHSLAKTIEFRSYFINFPPLLTKLMLNKWLLSFWEYLKNIAGFFSPSFFFTNGDLEGHFGVGNFGMFHLLEFPAIILGIFTVVKKKVKNLYPFLGWLLIVVFVVSINKITPHATRAYMMVIPMTVFSAYGFFTFFNKIERNKKISAISTVLITIFFCYSFFIFMLSYWVYFPVYFAQKWRSGDQKLVEYLNKTEPDYQTVIIDKKANLPYTSLLFYQTYDPFSFQQNARYESAGTLLIVAKIGKYEVRNIDWNKDLAKKNILIVSLPNLAPENLKAKKIFYYPKRPVVTFYDGKFGQYPVTDAAFAVYETQH